jgi:cobalt/nickel transport system ATP-binding protein
MSKYLEISNLTYEYPDGYKALNEISFDLEEGDSLGILGPNGAGKTTLILHLNGILGELDGSIKLNNVEFVEDNLAEIRKTVGVVVHAYCLRRCYVWSKEFWVFRRGQ